MTDTLLAIYSRRGSVTYFGEAVTTTEHSLQAAYFAQAAHAPDALVVATLLHDIGHLIEPTPENITEWKSDLRHEVNGSRWLTNHFGLEVSEPVRLHVAAKRYLCATDSSYVEHLSAASIKTLKLQGGPMAADEIREFEAEPFHRDAVLLRRWDDHGKVAGLATPDFGHYRRVIDRLSDTL
jgi:phosphonate degradation associated HDIG domain protein